jgi:hypothetical protein
MSEYDSGKAAEQQAAAIREKRESRLAGEAAMAVFLAEGGKIQKIANNVSGRVEGASYSAWGKPKKKAAATEQDSPADDDTDTDSTE